MQVVNLLLLVIAAICFLLAIFSVSERAGRFNLIAAGLFAWVLTVVIQALAKVF